MNAHSVRGGLPPKSLSTPTAGKHPDISGVRGAVVSISVASKDAHLKASGRHNICLRCSSSRDFETLDELEAHLTRYHYLCLDCNLYHESAENLREHDIDKRFPCFGL